MEREDTAGTKPQKRSANTSRVKGGRHGERGLSRHQATRQVRQQHLGLSGADMEREDRAGTKPIDRLGTMFYDVSCIMYMILLNVSLGLLPYVLYRGASCILFPEERSQAQLLYCPCI